MPRVIALVGSPRRNGKIAQLAQAALDGAKEAGAETELIHLYDLKITACTGCMACRPTGQCVMRDDDVAVLEDAVRAEGLILGSPTYWGNMSGVMSTAFERLSGFLLEESDRGVPRPRLGKGRAKTLLITACTTPWPFNLVCKQTNVTLGRMAEITHWSGYKSAGKIALPGTRGMKVIPPRVLARAKVLGRKLAQ